MGRHRGRGQHARVSCDGAEKSFFLRSLLCWVQPTSRLLRTSNAAFMPRLKIQSRQDIDTMPEMQSQIVKSSANANISAQRRNQMQGWKSKAVT
jgi:hypothetical protein